MAISTGYGPRRRDNGSRWRWLLFDGTKFWETKFLGYTLSLKDAILRKNLNEGGADTERNDTIPG